MKNSLHRIMMAVLMLTAFAAGVYGQRRVTPVAPRDPGAPVVQEKPAVDPSRLVSTMDTEGRTVMVDTVTGLEFVDSTLLKAPPRMEYPLLHEVVAGVNVWDPVMRALGQKYGLGDIWAEVSLHNRYFPYVGFGMGNCNDSPDGQNYTFKTHLSPYFKIGASYNFFYNSNPDYKLQMGLRYGFTPFKWSVDNVTVDEGYWDDPSHYNIPPQSCTAGYIEVTFGIKVRLFGHLSAGWTLIYHSLMHESASDMGKPMYIPGYGKRSGSITGNFSIMYTIPINKKPEPEVSL